jgi:prevent-host-death family protein
MRRTGSHSVGAFEAKTHLSALLERVAEGEVIEITRRGEPVARLVPVRAGGADVRKTAVEEMMRFGKGRRLGRVSIRQLIAAGRRF